MDQRRLAGRCARRVGRLQRRGKPGDAAVRRGLGVPPRREPGEVTGAFAAGAQRDRRADKGTGADRYRGGPADRLPQVLTTQTTGERALSWPPLRADLTGLLARWDALAERASDDERRDRALWVRGLLDDLIAAVDAENEALAAGRDWTLLRPHVDEANRALSAALATQPMSAGPAGRTTYPG